MFTLVWQPNFVLQTSIGKLGESSTFTIQYFVKDYFTNMKEEFM